MESIIGVAIIGYDGNVYSLPKPNRHHHVIHMMVKQYNHPIPINGEQGFITNEGKFVNRIEAKVIAVNNNQLTSRAGNEEELFSEDVW